jgi:hypothetical protein
LLWALLLTSVAAADCESAICLRERWPIVSVCVKDDVRDAVSCEDVLCGAGFVAVGQAPSWIVVPGSYTKPAVRAISAGVERARVADRRQYLASRSWDWWAAERS